MQAFYLVPLGADGRGGDDPDAVVAIDCFPCVVGRHSSCDRRLPDQTISRRHCRFWLSGGRVWVGDLGSRNGTLLNGQPVHGPRPLAEGDRLDLAGLPFLCLSRLPDEAAAAEVDEAFLVAGS
jgi:predicted component of type VI protein secretion system